MSRRGVSSASTKVSSVLADVERATANADTTITSSVQGVSRDAGSAHLMSHAESNRQVSITAACAISGTSLWILIERDSFTPPEAEMLTPRNTVHTH